MECFFFGGKNNRVMEWKEWWGENVGAVWVYVECGEVLGVECCF